MSVVQMHGSKGEKKVKADLGAGSRMGEAGCLRRVRDGQALPVTRLFSGISSSSVDINGFDQVGQSPRCTSRKTCISLQAVAVRQTDLGCDGSEETEVEGALR